MRRCHPALLAALCLMVALFAAPRAETAPAAEGKRVGWLTMDRPSAALGSYRDALRQALVGYPQLRQVTFEERHAAGNAGLLSTYAAELARLKVSVIVAAGHEAVRTAMQATSSIPIVMVASDPLVTGLVKKLDEPGGNVTGVAFESAELAHRRLQILTEFVPKLSVVAVVSQRSSAASVAETQAITTTAKALRITAQPVEAADIRVPRTTAMIPTPERAEAMLVPSEPWLLADARSLVTVATKLRVPAVFPFSEFADEGGLVAYGPNLLAMYRRAGSYAARVMTGARPGELPMERPSRSELVVNVRTAKALGIAVPVSLLNTADRIIPP
jgi:putative tryptophan/tyrosine transport system substrate-binding protein